MAIPFVDLTQQYQSIKPEIDASIQRVIESCAFVGGPYVEQFEKAFAAFCDAPYAIGCSSGTTALELALRAYGIGAGDEVIVPSHTFIATAEVVNNVGAIPVFAEIDEMTFTIDPRDIEQRITEKTRAIIPVHLYGQPCDMDPILELAKKHSLVVIEDCAQAHGAEYKGKKVPVSETGAFSFYPGKNLGAYGDAGAVVTQSESIATKMRELLDHGREAGKKYEHAYIGTNYRIDGIQGAILSVKLKHLPAWNERRRSAAQLYTEGLTGNPTIVVPTEAAYAKHVYHLYVIRSSKRDAVMETLRKNDIGCGIHYPIPLHLQPAYASLGYQKGDFPITEKIAEEVLSLPICGNVTDESIRTILSVI